MGASNNIDRMCLGKQFHKNRVNKKKKLTKFKNLLSIIDKTKMEMF